MFGPSVNAVVPSIFGPRRHTRPAHDTRGPRAALGALDQGQPVVVRQDTGSGYHAFCLLERVGAHKALAFDPDNKVGGLKVITLGKDFDANFGFRPM